MSIEKYLDQTKVRETAKILHYVSETSEKVAQSKCRYSELAATFLSEYDTALKIQKATADLREWFDQAMAMLDCSVCGNGETKKKYKQIAERVKLYENSIWDEALSEIFSNSPTWQN